MPGSRATETYAATVAARRTASFREQVVGDRVRGDAELGQRDRAFRAVEHLVARGDLLGRPRGQLRRIHPASLRSRHG